MSEPDQRIDVDKEEAFMRSFLQSERRILGFILSLVPHMSDAEDLLQETCSTMWRKHDEFEAGTNFTAWGISIARYKVLSYRRKMHSSKVMFSEPMMVQIAETTERLSPSSSARAEALQGCLKKLRENDREIIRLRYYAENSPKETARQLDRSVDSIYKSLNRIRQHLLSCIRQSLQTEGSLG
ncbi:ECF RNA polymerase sigma factor SigH [Rubripirellula amarantea]|uniref:ECF RNA polymerase sigma factor SigH n=1 Tax=Rubripirellula amarantea TaxID=2527999 RepID=A0A5C5WVG1_9BACT|nr:sigma-70 family RNA polymerase sigma factor [Rubripirellula amarantea]TWT54934.1 ECF RNA polymerase sigma factor SigH [Rubripirellula amarantea]